MKTRQGSRQPFPELRKDLRGMRYPAYVEPKLDGELNWFMPDKDEPHLINKSGKIRYSFPIAYELSSINVKLLGELYWRGGTAGALYEFLKHQTDDELKFMAFDVDLPLPYLERHKWLVENVRGMPHVITPLSVMALNEAQVYELYKQYADDMHYEGAVVKSFDSRLIMGVCPWVKIKKKDNLDLMIVAIDPTLERIEVQVPVDAVQVMAYGKKLSHTCGVKVPNKIKATLKVGDIVEIEHQGILSKGGLRHPVFVRRRDDKCV